MQLANRANRELTAWLLRSEVKQEVEDMNDEPMGPDATIKQLVKSAIMDGVDRHPHLVDFLGNYWEHANMGKAQCSVLPGRLRLESIVMTVRAWTLRKSGFSSTASSQRTTPCCWR